MSIAGTLRFKVSQSLIEAFARLSGDFSSIHIVSEFGRLSRYRQTVMHGMLPLVYLAAVLGERPELGSLKKLKCQFLEPCYIDDVLEIRWDVNEGNRRSFTIIRIGAGAPATKGEIELYEKSALSVLKQGITTPPEGRSEQSYFLSDISVGTERSFEFILYSQIDLQVVKTFIEHIVSGPTLSFEKLDPHFLSSLFMSTFIGMEIPGRYATLSEVSAEFPSDPIKGSVTLTGKVDKVMTGSSRIKVGFQWKQGEAVIGTGHAWSMVGGAHPVGISSKSIQEAYLSSGISGRVALITGASRGIGEATAKLLALQGAKVAVHYFRGEAAAKSIVADICDAGGSAIAVGADIRDEAQVKQLFERVTTSLGPVDILVNSAVDEFSPKEFETLEWSDFLGELEVSLKGLHACCKEAVPGMKARKWGKIVTIGTIAVESPVAGQNKYITVKSALTGYTRSLASELARENIQVNLVVPRMTKTSLLAGLPSEFVNRLAQESAAGAILEPIEVARTISFLVSEWAKPISGQKLVLNQGEMPFL